MALQEPPLVHHSANVQRLRTIPILEGIGGLINALIIIRLLSFAFPEGGSYLSFILTISLLSFGLPGGS